MAKYIAKTLANPFDDLDDLAENGTGPENQNDFLDHPPTPPPPPKKPPNPYTVKWEPNTDDVFETFTTHFGSVKMPEKITIDEKFKKKILATKKGTQPMPVFATETTIDGIKTLKNIATDAISSSVKDSLVVVQEPRMCSITMVVINKNDAKNSIRTIVANQGKAINNAVFDSTKDCYLVRGVDTYQLCDLPFVCVLKNKGETTTWWSYVPTPESMILDNIPGSIKEDYQLWKAGYDQEKYYFEVMQIIHVF